jgi:pantothenate kinase
MRSCGCARDEEAVAVPVFDRDIEIARAGARLIPRSVRIIVAEGNYLLLARPPWDGLAAALRRDRDDRGARAGVARRLTARWQGYDLTPGEIAGSSEATTCRTAAMVREESAPADCRARQDA